MRLLNYSNGVRLIAVIAGLAGLLFPSSFGRFVQLVWIGIPARGQSLSPDAVQ